MENPFAGMSLQELLEAERALKRAFPVRYWLAEANEFLNHPVSSLRAWRRLRILRPLLLTKSAGALEPGQRDG